MVLRQAQQPQSFDPDTFKVMTNNLTTKVKRFGKMLLWIVGCSVIGLVILLFSKQIYIYIYVQIYKLKLKLTQCR